MFKKTNFNKFSVPLFVYGLLLVVNTGVIIYFIAENSKKTAYIEPVKVYDNFILTKKLNVKFQNFNNLRKKEIDTLYLSYQSLIRKYSEKAPSKEQLTEIKMLKEKILEKQEKFESEKDALFKGYENQIWTQINTQIAKYGKEKGYDFILGASGTGSIMYASQGKDITPEIIEYINSN